MKKLRSLVKMECKWRLKLTKMLKLGVVGGRGWFGNRYEGLRRP